MEEEANRPSEQEQPEVEGDGEEGGIEATPLGDGKEAFELPSRAGQAVGAAGTQSREVARPPGAVREKEAAPERSPQMREVSMPAGRGERAEWAGEREGITARIERLENWVKNNRLT